MFKSLVVLAMVGTMSAPVLAQTAPTTDQTQTPAKPQTVKKRVCETIEEDPSSRLGNRKICRMIEVPVKSPADAPTAGNQAPATQTGGQ